MKKKVSKWKKNKEKQINKRVDKKSSKIFLVCVFFSLILFTLLLFNRQHVSNIFLSTTSTYKNKSNYFYKISSYPNVKIRFDEFDMID